MGDTFTGKSMMVTAVVPDTMKLKIHIRPPENFPPTPTAPLDVEVLSSTSIPDLIKWTKSELVAFNKNLKRSKIDLEIDGNSRKFDRSHTKTLKESGFTDNGNVIASIRRAH